MRKLVECVPNFSEGRDRGVIEAIATSIRDAAGCTLLDVDPGASTNRTVYTFVGEPEAVVAGALAAARVARERIDMRRHSGEHPRIGALDVCPFVPVSGVTMEDCVWCANLFGEALAVELGVPVFLYGHAARADHRRTLQQIRSGEYEALAERVARPEWTPDFGPASLVPEWGATAVGARGFLVAYNVNVLGTKEQAHRIALDIRETGRGPEDPGALKAVRGMGWYVEEYGLAQVSMNLEDFRTTGLREAFGACVEAARRLGVAVCGSELVGLVPRDALLLAAEHFIREEGLFLVEEGQKIRLAVERLGLSSIQPFVPATRVIEFMLPSVESPLGSKTVREFVQAVGARTPTPGGGSVSALVGALGAALGAMVGWMTYGKRRFEEKDALMRAPHPSAPRGHGVARCPGGRGLPRVRRVLDRPWDGEGDSGGEDGAGSGDAGRAAPRDSRTSSGDADRRHLLGRPVRPGSPRQYGVALGPRGGSAGSRDGLVGLWPECDHQPRCHGGRGVP